MTNKSHFAPRFLVLTALVGALLAVGGWGLRADDPSPVSRSLTKPMADLSQVSKFPFVESDVAERQPPSLPMPPMPPMPPTPGLIPAAKPRLVLTTMPTPVSHQEAAPAPKLGLEVIAPENLLAQKPAPEKIAPPPGVPEKIAPPQPSPKPLTEAPQVLTHDASVTAGSCEPHLFARGEYLLWCVREGRTPVLFTTAPDVAGANGILGESTTQILFGTHDMDFGALSGVRATAGANFGVDEFWGFEISGFVLEQGKKDFTAASNAEGLPLLVRPFLNVLDTLESGFEVASSGNLQGAIHIHGDSQFWGAESNLVAHSVRDGNRRFDLIAGYRFLDLDERITIQENLVALKEDATLFHVFLPPTGQPATFITVKQGARVIVYDDFSTRNRFNGGQFGGRFQWMRDRWTLDLTAKIAFGFTHEESRIFGLSVLNNPGEPTVAAPGGVLALTVPPGNPAGAPTSNIGTLSRDAFAVVPEVNLQVHYDVTSRIRASVGYNGLYCSAMARPGDQMDRLLNPKLVPTGGSFNPVTEPFNPRAEQTRPAGGLRDSGFWANGLNVGLEFRY